MTPSEFKAWFDGFTEAIADIGPTTAQWARIKARVAEIDGKPVTERVYTMYLSAAGAVQQGAIGSGGPAFDGASAMAALGRAEVTELAGA